MKMGCSIEQKDFGVFLSNERKTKWVTMITFITMVVEIVAGYWSGSMSLLADGWHMASHTLALLLSLVVYYLYRHPKFRSSFTFGGGKILSLGGYSSALILIIIAGSMMVESGLRFFNVQPIHFSQALWIAVIGLVVNLVCALIMHQKEDLQFVKVNHNHHDHHDHNCAHHHHGHHHVHDHNHQGAYIHILTDAFTSVLAIIALFLGQNWGLIWLDALVGFVGGLVVMKWALGLLRESGLDLLDAHEESINREAMIKEIEKDGSQVMDMHLWKLAPGQIGCELIIRQSQNQKSQDYRNLLSKHFKIQHLVIEVI